MQKYYLEGNIMSPAKVN